MNLPLTGAQYQIAAGDYAAVVTELGAGLRELHHQGRAVVAGYPPGELPPGAAGQLLVPWPNRVDKGRYTVNGTPLQLDLSEPGRGNAIHGLTRWLAWSMVRHTPWDVLLRVRLLGTAGYPFCLEVDAEYQLSAEQGLEVSITARNLGSAPAPYGAGAHPYLRASETVDDCELTLPCTHWLPADERGIPVGAVREVAGSETDFRVGRRIGVTSLDHAMTGLIRDPDGLARARLAGPRSEVTLWAGPGFRWLQVFTGDTLDARHRRRALAVEPMTCPPNAFASGTDLIMVEPGTDVSHTWGIAADR